MNQIYQLNLEIFQISDFVLRKVQIESNGQSIDIWMLIPVWQQKEDSKLLN